ncbi:ATP-binding protein [Sphingomonas glaciei]|uniref:ATP-binding protein n=1 Tax=Sphingomonas glaciei TaxID=2938948 RepID=A0ABY5MWB6_9SPHN|nr:ATP-binding protein [Sphingomonas glaciei]UUR08286.1 ATP-binding protein [Sphingomonas glaciei]
MDEPVIIDDGGKLAVWLADAGNEGQTVRTRLAASDRVIARVTDGIYRQPASALRELISNAWDADASKVTILTDAPRFSRIYVRDNGRGMSHATLSRLLKNIGGSAKRSEEGADLGITSEHDSSKTPAGRPLIGKIGIGLFSISQLARRFQIITKVEGAPYRLIAEIKLRAYAEDGSNQVEAEDGDEFISGEVFVRREAVKDLSSHGTDIILDDIKPRVRDILRSADRWRAVIEREEALEKGDLDTYTSMRVSRPSYHSGFMAGPLSGATEPSILAIQPTLPWAAEDPSDCRMLKLVEAVEGEFTRVERPDLNQTLDAYLEMIWSLGLSAPVPYVEKHPFELTAKDNIDLFWITKERGRGLPVSLEGSTTVREAIEKQVEGNPKLRDGLDAVGRFDVSVDGVLLKRPIRFKHRPTAIRGLERPILFVGQYAPDLSKHSPSQRGGGELSLDAYLFWTGRIVPKENNGVLVRIRGASGSLFDPTFFKYQVSEQTRLRQITSELLVYRGLDAALNIDRESFNFAHPHLQLVTLYLHGAIRQLTNRLKDKSSELRASRREQEERQRGDRLGSVVANLWQQRKGDSSPPSVVLATDDRALIEARESGSLAFQRTELIAPDLQHGGFESEPVVKALVQVLAAFDVFEDRPYEEQQKLVSAIVNLVWGDRS